MLLPEVNIPSIDTPDSLADLNHRYRDAVAKGDQSFAHDIAMEAAQDRIDSLRRLEPGDHTFGLMTGSTVPNTSSIPASLGSDYISMGVREVPMVILGPDPEPEIIARFKISPSSAQLVADIKASGEITPLIVVVRGISASVDTVAYVLEGSHRIDALELMQVKSFPALVVLDTSSEGPEMTESGELLSLEDRFPLHAFTLPQEQVMRVSEEGKFTRLEDDRGGQALLARRDGLLDVVDIHAAPSEKRYSPEADGYARKGFARRVISSLSQLGETEFSIKLQSNQCQAAMAKLVKNGELRAKLGFTAGSSGNEHPTRFDIVKERCLPVRLFTPGSPNHDNELLKGRAVLTAPTSTFESIRNEVELDA